MDGYKTATHITEQNLEENQIKWNMILGQGISEVKKLTIIFFFMMELFFFLDVEELERGRDHEKIVESNCDFGLGNVSTKLSRFHSLKENKVTRIFSLKTLENPFIYIIFV
ncbi:hypothetical protein C0J52_17602 [Blattella germanica]|nr:hypothetical protein C0J52_17602 [Blattella germanica]